MADLELPPLPEVYSSVAPIDVSCLIVMSLWAKLRSKDPNTKVGACVYHSASDIMAFGYNGFNRGVPDRKDWWDNRDRASSTNKYVLSVHAETSAIRKASIALGGDLSGCVLYVTHYPCHCCMKDDIVPSKIKRVIYMSDYPADPATELQASLNSVKLEKAKLDLSIQCPTSITASDSLELKLSK
jgi:deoxycytidylate deaminase